MKDSRFREPVVGQRLDPLPGRPVFLAPLPKQLPERTSPERLLPTISAGKGAEVEYNGCSAAGASSAGGAATGFSIAASNVRPAFVICYPWASRMTSDRLKMSKPGARQQALRPIGPIRAAANEDLRLFDDESNNEADQATEA